MLVTLSLLSSYMVAPPVPRTAVRCADCRMDLFGDVAKAAGDMAKAAGDAATSLLDEPEEPKKRFAPKRTRRRRSSRRRARRRRA